MSFQAFSALSKDLVDLTSSASPRLVAVVGADGRFQSGILWRTGLVVTAHEALNGEDDVKVVGADGKPVAAAFVGRDPTTDVALLKLESATAEDWPAAPTPVPGALVAVLGRGEYSALAGLGTVQEVGPAWRSMRGGAIDARINLSVRLSSRAEGGAAVDTDGKLIGMAVTGARRSVLVIPASTIARSVETLLGKGYVPRPYLGLTLYPVANGKGAVVTGIEDGSPAATGGFRIGDVITTWNGAAADSVREILSRLQQQPVGDSIKLGVSRGGEAVELNIVVGERARA